MKHLHTLGIAFPFKTATVCCGKRVKFTDLAIMEDTDCPVCRQTAEMEHATALQMVNKARESGMHVDELAMALLAGPRYRNAVLG